MFTIYLVILALFVAERILELRISKKHETFLKSAGAFEVGQDHFFAMKLLHTTFLMSCLIEAYLKTTEPPLWQFLFFTFVVILTQLTRYWVIKSLGTRWTVNVMILPDAPLITHGPYKYFRHPNYIAVIVEIIALPLIFNNFYTATVFTLLNAILLYFRISIEEKALRGSRAN